jgi:hypothetical protein
MRFHSSRRLTLAAFALVMGLAGCASGGGGGGGGGSGNRLTIDDMSEVQQLSVYQTIQRLRPRWLRQRSNKLPNVYIDGSRRTGGLDDLRSMRTSEVQEMQYLSGSDATTRFGTGNDGGAILVTTRR